VFLMPSLPLWARALRRFDRAAWFVHHIHEITRDELLFAWLRPDLRSTMTVAAYSKMRTYLPGGSTFEEGLFGWERQLFAQPSIPRRGRVLLAAAGGGRELKGLLQSGYSVCAFEPNPVLFEGARRVAGDFDTAELIPASYADLVAAASAQGPLAHIREQPFDWVLFGWGSFTHLTERSVQLDVLRAMRAIAPRAPLAMSFFLRKPEGLDSRSRRLRLLLRSALRRMGRDPQTIADGLGYDYGGGFVYSFTMAEVSDLALQAKYRIEYQDDATFPCAILLPD
jgi:hypothetical protein